MTQNIQFENLSWLVLTSGKIVNEVRFMSHVPRTPFVHGLDPKTAEAIDVVWRCLHLPRGPMDCFDIQPSHLKLSREIGNFHRIGVTSIQQLREATLSPASLGRIGLVMAPDAFVEEARHLTKDWNIELGVVGHSNIHSQAAIDESWRAVVSMAGDRGARRLGLSLVPLSRGAAEHLSLAYRARHYIANDERPRDRSHASSESLIFAALELDRHASAVIVVEAANVSSEAQQHVYAEAIKLQRAGWPLVVGALGAPQTLRELAKSPLNQPPDDEVTASPEDESRALEAVIAHCAIGRQSFGLRLPDITHDLFVDLESIEQLVVTEQRG